MKKPTGPRPRTCYVCKTVCEDADTVPGVGHCWPCWVLRLRFGKFPAGWWQVCDRCGQRNYVLTDRPLCATCIRVPGKWRLTVRLCVNCGRLFRPRGNRVAKNCCAHHHLRRTRTVAGRKLGTHTRDEWEACLEGWAAQCAYCGSGGPLTKDHVVPLARGGSDAIENIVPACARCNSAKGARLLSEWWADAA